MFNFAMLNCCGCFNYCICKYIYKKVIIKFCNFSYCNFVILNYFSFGRQPGCPRRPKFFCPSDSPIDGPCVGSVARCSPRPPAMKPSVALRFSALALSLPPSLPARGAPQATARDGLGGGPPSTRRWPPSSSFSSSSSTTPTTTPLPPRDATRRVTRPRVRPSVAGHPHGRAASQRRPLCRRSSPPSPPSACRSSPPATTSSPTTTTVTPSTTSSEDGFSE